LEQRAREIGRHTLEQILPSQPGETDLGFFRRVADVVGRLLSGYSIGHVDGRFRASSLLDYQQAAQILATRGRYLVDETTAVVRFILPIAESRSAHGGVFDLLDETPFDKVPVDRAVRTARKLFIHFFVESVILDIHAEDEIWFLESGPDGERLYVLERDSGTTASVPPGKETDGGKPAQASSTVIPWLRASGYREIADLIEEIESGWRANGLKTRRNWFEILAGDRKGRPRAVAGKTFPVIASIRRRQGLDPVTDALIRKDETPLPARGSA
jgi:hypothetical protein